jgi:enterochelin esterase-like enzyme
VLDGPEFVEEVGAAEVIDELVATGEIPPTVGLFLDSVSRETRDVELRANVAFTRFLAEEVVPDARARYDAGLARGDVVVVGASDGGLCAVFAAAEHPAVFGHALALSGSFWWKPSDAPDDWLARRLGLDGASFFLYAGRQETRAPRPGGPSVVAATRALRDAIEARGLRVEHSEREGWHYYPWWREPLRAGLVTLLGTAS